MKSSEAKPNGRKATAGVALAKAKQIELQPIVSTSPTSVQPRANLTVTAKLGYDQTAALHRSVQSVEPCFVRTAKAR